MAETSCLKHWRKPCRPSVCERGSFCTALSVLGRVWSSVHTVNGTTPGRAGCNSSDIQVPYASRAHSSLRLCAARQCTRRTTGVEIHPCPRELLTQEFTFQALLPKYTWDQSKVERFVKAAKKYHAKLYLQICNPCLQRALGCTGVTGSDFACLLQVFLACLRAQGVPLGGLHQVEGNAHWTMHARHWISHPFSWCQ